MSIYLELKAGMKFKYLGKDVKSNGVRHGEILTLAEDPEITFEGFTFKFTKRGSHGDLIAFTESRGSRTFNQMFVPVGKDAK